MEKPQNGNDLYIVHCVDTEGPLYESLEATVERLKKAFGISIQPTEEDMARLNEGVGVDLRLKKQIDEFLSRISYKTNWRDLDEMLDEIMSERWRNSYLDDYGRGYKFNWFVVDHVGCNINPRRRSLGYHSIYEHYRSRLARGQGEGDRLYWHFHPVSYCFEAHKTSNSFGFTNEHLNILSRRVIDYLDFPVAYRPGCHLERPDINVFLEFWIPFDYGNQGMPERAEDKAQADLAGGRFGDWRKAPAEWEVYHPDFYDYQKKGQMQRYIARCLNLDSRVRPITRQEIQNAFRRANSGKPTILSITNHDEREMRPSIDWFMRTVREVQREGFPDVRIRHANAVEAIRAVEGLDYQDPAQLTFSWEDNRLVILSNKALWGPQPYFCFKTCDKRYIHENLDLREGGGWSFTFDDDTICLHQIECIGVATHDQVGNTSVYRILPSRELDKTEQRFLNQDWLHH